MRAAAPQSRSLCCISVQMKSYPAFAIAQYVAGSVALNSVPPVTLPPWFIFTFTGFQIFDPAGGSKAGPYFHVLGLNGPVLTAPGGATFFALLSRPAGAASGNCVAPGFALLAYGSAVGGGCVCCWLGVWAVNVARPNAAQTTVVSSTCFMVISCHAEGESTLADPLACAAETMHRAVAEGKRRLIARKEVVRTSQPRRNITDACREQERPHVLVRR